MRTLRSRPMKELLWLISDYKEDALVNGASYFENAEWYISRYPKYSFAAKAGHNGELHNHCFLRQIRPADTADNHGR